MNEKDKIIDFLKWIKKAGYFYGSDGRWFVGRLINHGTYSDEELFEIYKQYGTGKSS